ncbi:MAG: tyrosine-protein phosphatase [Ruminococcus sp.]|nr:tyrosine-protein phosphatase [Ruminococcus sp.]
MAFIFENTLNTRPILEDSLRFIRSDVPTAVSEQEKQWLIKNDITTIVDLRTDDEREKKTCPLASDKRFSYHAMPVIGGNVIGKSVCDVSKSYIKMVDSNLLDTIDFILCSKSNVLYFCNAGKDRTGVVSAIMLYKNGMDSKYIIDDYLKSAVNLKDMLQSFAKENPDVDINIITPNKRYMEEFLEWYMNKMQQC